MMILGLRRTLILARGPKYATQAWGRGMVVGPGYAVPDQTGRNAGVVQSVINPPQVQYQAPTQQAVQYRPPEVQQPPNVRPNVNPNLRYNPGLHPVQQPYYPQGPRNPGQAPGSNTVPGYIGGQPQTPYGQQTAYSPEQQPTAYMTQPLVNPYSPPRLQVHHVQPSQNSPTQFSQLQGQPGQFYRQQTGYPQNLPLQQVQQGQQFLHPQDQPSMPMQRQYPGTTAGMQDIAFSARPQPVHASAYAPPPLHPNIQHHGPPLQQQMHGSDWPQEAQFPTSNSQYSTDLPQQTAYGGQLQFSPPPVQNAYNSAQGGVHTMPRGNHHPYWEETQTLNQSWVPNQRAEISPYTRLNPVQHQNTGHITTKPQYPQSFQVHSQAPQQLGPTSYTTHEHLYNERMHAESYQYPTYQVAQVHASAAQPPPPQHWQRPPAGNSYQDDFPQQQSWSNEHMRSGLQAPYPAETLSLEQQTMIHTTNYQQPSSHIQAFQHPSTSPQVSLQNPMQSMGASYPSPPPNFGQTPHLQNYQQQPGPPGWMTTPQPHSPQSVPYQTVRPNGFAQVGHTMHHLGGVPLQAHPLPQGQTTLHTMHQSGGVPVQTPPLQQGQTIFQDQNQHLTMQQQQPAAQHVQAFVQHQATVPPVISPPQQQVVTAETTFQTQPHAVLQPQEFVAHEIGESPVESNAKAEQQVAEEQVAVTLEEAHSQVHLTDIKLEEGNIEIHSLDINVDSMQQFALDQSEDVTSQNGEVETHDEAGLATKIEDQSEDTMGAPLLDRDPFQQEEAHDTDISHPFENKVPTISMEGVPLSESTDEVEAQIQL